jgi:hypothetical protein
VIALIMVMTLITKVSDVKKLKQTGIKVDFSRLVFAQRRPHKRYKYNLGGTFCDTISGPVSVRIAKFLCIKREKVN